MTNNVHSLHARTETHVGEDGSLADAGKPEGERPHNTDDELHEGDSPVGVDLSARLLVVHIVGSVADVPALSGKSGHRARRSRPAGIHAHMCGYERAEDPTGLSIQSHRASTTCARGSGIPALESISVPYRTSCEITHEKAPGPRPLHARKQDQSMGYHKPALTSPR